MDTGACVSVICGNLYERYFGDIKIISVCDKKFNNIDGRQCEVLRKINLCLNFSSQVQALEIKSVQSLKMLIGRTWLDVLCPSWREFFDKNLLNLNSIRSIKNENFVDATLKDFQSVFESSKEPIVGVTAPGLELKENFTPKFHKSSVIPFVLRDKVNEKLKMQENKGIIVYVEESDWASQIVVVKKKNDDLRICCNYKNTLNPQLKDNKYPLSIIDDLLSELGGNKYFCLLDLEGAYTQLLLDEKSRSLTTINTRLGLYMT